MSRQLSFADALIDWTRVALKAQGIKDRYVRRKLSNRAQAIDGNASTQTRQSAYIPRERPAAQAKPKR
jgi:hypothetical protein